MKESLGVNLFCNKSVHKKIQISNYTKHAIKLERSQLRIAIKMQISLKLLRKFLTTHHITYTTVSDTVLGDTVYSG